MYCRWTMAYHMRSNYSRTKLSRFLWSRGPSCEYFYPRIFGRWCCITVKMDVKRTHTMPHCSVCSACGSKYDRSVVAHQLDHSIVLLWRVHRCWFVRTIRSGSTICPSWKRWFLLLWQRQWELKWSGQQAWNRYRRRRQFEWEQKWQQGYKIYVVLQI